MKHFVTLFLIASGLLTFALAASGADLCCLFEVETTVSSTPSAADIDVSCDDPCNSSGCSDRGSECSGCGLTHAMAVAGQAPREPLLVGQAREGRQFSALPATAPDCLLEPPIA